MRQGNGSDLLGPSDPRSATIGIIYVAPNDDRESVLAAILTQEKLGRKQIAIVLPSQNKAFQRPVDFDGLKNMRRKLQANLVIVASHGSSPAEFARQRHFPLFTSLENYGQSLRDENEASRATKRGWFGARNRKPLADTGSPKSIEDVPTGAVPANNESQNRVQPAPDNVDEGIEEQHASPNVAAMGMGIGAGALAADQLMHRPGDGVDPMPPLMQHQDAADDDLALSASTPQAVDSSPAGGGPAQDEMQPPPPGQIPAGEDRADIIRFPQSSRGRDAENVPLPPDRSEPEEEPVPAVVPSPTPIGRRSSGKMAPVGAAGVGVGAGAVGGAVTPGRMPRTGGPFRDGSRGAGGGPRRRLRTAQLWLVR